MKTLETLIQELQEAKKNVIRLLENPDWLAWMHGLEYWAWRVETLRKQIKELL